MKYQGMPFRIERPMTLTTSVIESPEMHRPGSAMMRTPAGNIWDSPRDTTRQKSSSLGISVR